MNVVFITHYTELYGANRSLLNLIEGLQEYGVYPIVIVPTEGDLTKVLKAINVEFIIFEFLYDFINVDSLKNTIGYYTRFKLFYHNFKRAKILSNIIKGRSISIVYSNSSVFFIGIYLSKFLKVPHVWHIREHAEAHYNIIPNLGKAYFKLLLSQSSANIFVSNWLHKQILTSPRKNSFIIYNGVITREKILEYKSKCLSLDDPSFIFCIVGVIHPNKGQMDAIKAFALLKKRYSFIKLQIAGAGTEYKDNIIKFIKENNVQDVYFLGEVKDPFKVFENSHVSLMCSKFEAMGRVTVESMCCKTPVIGRDTSGTSELISHNVTGLLYDGSIEDLAHQMGTLVQNKKLLANLSENAWNWAYKNVSQEKYAESVYNLISYVSLSKKD